MRDVEYDSEGRFGSMLKQRRASLTAKFMFGLGIILLGVITALSFLTYSYLKKIYIREAYEKTDIVLGHIDATMEYARDELRPQIFHILPGNIFIRQVMSSTFMNMGIMSRFKKRFPHYIYKRVALDPMNPANKADPFEERFIKQFRDDPASKRQWRGLVSRNGQDYFLHLKAVVAKEECLLCHGDPASSPESINLHYGTVHGRHWKVGDVIGLESIAAPVSETFRQLRHVALSFFLFGIAGMAALFAGLNYFHYRLAVVPLKRVSSFFKEVVDGHRGLNVHFDVSKGQSSVLRKNEKADVVVPQKEYYYDEVYKLADSFNRMMSYLKKSEEERKEMEERVIQADKLASIGRLGAGVAHEINNPLSVILGYTNILRQKYPESDQTKEDLDIIFNNALLCKKIVEDLLNFARQTKTIRVPTEINAAIDSAMVPLEEILRSGEITVVRDYDTELPPLAADEDKLKRVFTNLVLNAFQAMQPGGRLTISTSYDRERNGVRIAFSDTGCGIPEEIRDKIFEPFFTTKPPGKGTGLGLSVSYGIVKEHKGELSVISEKGKGSTFTLWFPLAGDKG
jgi:signal transduction histidine kinase